MNVNDKIVDEKVGLRNGPKGTSHKRKWKLWLVKILNEKVLGVVRARAYNLLVTPSAIIEIGSTGRGTGRGILVHVEFTRRFGITVATVSDEIHWNAKRAVSICK